MREKVLTEDRLRREPKYLYEKHVSIARASNNQRLLCTFFVGIKDISICVSKRKLIGNGWCFPIASPFVVC